MQIRVADYIIKYLETIGVKQVFCLTGGGAMFLNDALAKSKNIETIFPLHEQSCAIMAEAYSIYKNEIGVSVTTTGPGGTNLITGITSAWIDSTPVLFITGQVKTADMIGMSHLRQKGMQEVDIVGIVKPITKYATTVKRPEDIKSALSTAVRSAMVGRKGPVLIDVPLDIQMAMIEDDVTDITISIYNPFLMAEELETIINSINNSKRPVLLLGNGIQNCNKGLIDKFIHEFKIPVLLTWKTMDILDEDDEYNFGRPGSIASRYANFILQKSDCLISIGARLDFGQVAFNYDNFAPNAVRIIIDTNSAELDKLPYPKDTKFLADAHNVIMDLYRNITKIIATFESWVKECTELKNKYPLLPVDIINPFCVNTYNFVDELSRQAIDTDIIVPSSAGSASEVVCQAFKFKKGQRVICSNGLGSMGFALPHAIGSSLASNKGRVICIEGDGSLQHNIQELELMSRHYLPVKLFILNNKGYASIRATQNKFFDGDLFGSGESSGLTLPNLKKIADAYCINYVSIDNESEIQNKLKLVLAENNPVICEVMIDLNMTTQPRVMNSVNAEGKIVSGKLENLFPFLDEAEISEVMK